MTENYETHAKGIRILPGKWRPHYPFEQIAWISPPWPCQDYIYLDFPEAIFSNVGVLFLSHVNPSVPTVFTHLPAVPWKSADNQLSFVRSLPNGVVFGGLLASGDPSVVEMELFIHNGTEQPMRDIKLQTCAFLRGIREFSEYSMSNKRIHLADKGWIPFEAALEETATKGRYGLGWRGGPERSDLPVLVTLSAQDSRLVGMTWYKHTLSLIGNPNRPCMHADPFFPDLEPGQEARICGELLFFEGSIESFEKWFRQRSEGRQNVGADAASSVTEAVEHSDSQSEPSRIMY